MQLKIHYFKTISFSSDPNVKHFFFANVLQWPNNGDCALSPHWTTVPHGSCRNFGSSHRLRRENDYIHDFGNGLNMSALTFPSRLKETSKCQASSLWWPEHCKDEGKMNLHRQQADVYQLLKGLFVFVYAQPDMSWFSHPPRAVTMNVLNSCRNLFHRRVAIRNSAGSDCRWSQADSTKKEG